jgi:hypothetical protein
MGHLLTNQQAVSFENSFLRYSTAIFTPLIGIIFILDTMVIHISTVTHLTPVLDIPIFSVSDIIILYSLSTCAVFTISLLFGYYGVWRDHHKQVQIKSPNYLSMRKTFDFYNHYNHQTRLVYGTLMIISVTVDSLMVLLYSSNLSTADIVILYSLTIALVSVISLLFGYYRTKRELRGPIQEGI